MTKKMYLKVIKKDNVKYYILYVYDKNNMMWVNRFVTEKIYNVLKDILKVY